MFVFQRVGRPVGLELDHICLADESQVVMPHRQRALDAQALAHLIARLVHLRVHSLPALRVDVVVECLLEMDQPTLAWALGSVLQGREGRVSLSSINGTSIERSDPQPLLRDDHEATVDRPCKGVQGEREHLRPHHGMDPEAKHRCGRRLAALEDQIAEIRIEGEQRARAVTRGAQDAPIIDSRRSARDGQHIMPGETQTLGDLAWDVLVEQDRPRHVETWPSAALN